MRATFVGYSCALLALAALSCSADSVTGNGEWQTIRIGPWETIQEYTNGHGASPTNMAFVGSSHNVDLQFAFDPADLGPTAYTVGYYLETKTGAIAAMVPLLSSTKPNRNDLLTVLSGTEYGFYLESVDGRSETFYFMNSALNSSGSGHAPSQQFFSLYRSGTTDTLIVQIPDPSRRGVLDSLLVIALDPANDPPQTPEPASLLMMMVASGVITVFGCRGGALRYARKMNDSSGGIHAN